MPTEHRGRVLRRATDDRLHPARDAAAHAPVGGRILIRAAVLA